MNSSRSSVLRAAGLCLALLASGASTGGAAEFVFNLLPKAFQSAPTLETTVNTEMTPYGRMLRIPSSDDPMYYTAQSVGFRPMGQAIGGERSPRHEQLQSALEKSLEKAGYLPAQDPDKRPTLLIVYFWGSHNRLDPEEASNFPELANRHRLERARLVGGPAFVRRMATIMEFGETLFDRAADVEFLREQVESDLYYVVASAYDYAALSRNERRLLWRTTMTVAATGVSMTETLPTLIGTASPLFGRETEKPQVARPRIHRWGVKVGDPTVVESDVPLPPRAQAPLAPAKRP